MNQTPASTIYLDGTLKSDGSLEFDVRPPLPPGRVRVALQPLATVRETIRLPDPPWLDDCIAAPFDLPYPTTSQQVQPRLVAERLPEPWEPVQGEAE